jgi:hypothetical protein
MTPFTKTVIVGSRNSVTAPTPQSLSGSSLGFASWSDGGTRSHEIVASATATTYTATYKPEAAAPGLVLGYGFEETSGTAATDASAAKNNGTVNGATQTASGRFGRALSFDDVNDRVDVPDSASLELTNALTLGAWVRPTNSRACTRRRSPRKRPTSIPTGSRPAAKSKGSPRASSRCRLVLGDVEDTISAPERQLEPPDDL